MPTLIIVTVAAVAMPIALFAFILGESDPTRATVAMVLYLAPTALIASGAVSRWEKKHGKREKGARGEISAGKELERLHVEGFHVFHDYKPEASGNVDHFLVGEGGVFIVETKSWSGEISSDGYNIFVNGASYRKSPIKQAAAEAYRIRELLKSSCGINVWVQPILCFADGDLRVYGKVGVVEVTSLGALNRSVMQLAHGNPDHRRLSASQVRAISGRLTQHLGELPATSPGNPPEPPGRMKKLLRADRMFVISYITLIFALSIAFAGNTATMFENLASLYRFIETVLNFYF